MQMEDKMREENCPNTGQRGEKVEAARPLTKPALGNRTFVTAWERRK
jgi:hypothetical protein